MRPGFEPDPRLDTEQPNRKEPNWNGTIEMKRLDMDMTSRADRAATPAVGEQRPTLRPVDKIGIGLRPDKPSPKRRLHWCDQQAVIAAGQAAGDCASGVSAEAVGKPPFAALCLLQVAADCMAETHELRNGQPLGARVIFPGCSGARGLIQPNPLPRFSGATVNP